MMPTFLDSGPVTIDEDPTPFIVERGVCNKYAIVGDSRTAMNGPRAPLPLGYVFLYLLSHFITFLL